MRWMIRIRSNICECIETIKLAGLVKRQLSSIIKGTTWRGSMEAATLLQS